MTLFNIVVDLENLKTKEYRTFYNSLKRGDLVVVHQADRTKKTRRVSSVVGAEVQLENIKDIFLDGWNGVMGYEAKIIMPFTENDERQIERSRLINKLNSMKVKDLSLDGLRMLEKYIHYLQENYNQPPTT